MVKTITLSREADISDVLDTACAHLIEKQGQLYVQTDGEIDLVSTRRDPTYYRVMHEYTLPHPIEVKRFLGLGRRTITAGKRELFYLDIRQSQIRVGLEDEAIVQACELASKNPLSFKVRLWSWDK